MCLQLDVANPELDACFAHAPQAGSPAGALCRGWSQFSTSWVTGGLGSPLLLCQESIGVDKFMIIMGCFGSMIKIVEPIARIQARKDIHQKTLIMILTVLGALGPSVALAKYGIGCLDGLSEWGRPFGSQPVWGGGALAFSLTVVLLPPVVTLHLIVPSGTHSIRFQQESRLQPRPVRV